MHTDINPFLAMNFCLIIQVVQYLTCPFLLWIAWVRRIWGIFKKKTCTAILNFKKSFSPFSSQTTQLFYSQHLRINFERGHFYSGPFISANNFNTYIQSKSNKFFEEAEKIVISKKKKSLDLLHSHIGAWKTFKYLLEFATYFLCKHT